jgi:hypothetical protein
MQMVHVLDNASLAEIRAYNEGAYAASYSYGIGACPYDASTNLYKFWLAGYTAQYANG